MTTAPNDTRRNIPTSGIFDKQYFNNGPQSGTSAYEGYLSGYQPDLWALKGGAIVDAAGLRPSARVIDFGCAAGYLVRYCRELGLDACGLEVSAAALEHADPIARQFLFHRQDRDTHDFADGYFDLAVAKDVLEHVPLHDLPNVIAELRRISRKLFVAVPVACSDGGVYIDPISELDPTHVIRWTAQTWCEMLAAPGRTPQLLTDACIRVLGAERAVGRLFTIL